MYNLKRNNYNLKPKNSTIYTPPEVAQFIFELLSPKIWDWRSTYNMGGFILDPCCGQGNLLEPWKKEKEFEKGYPAVGVDLDPNSSADWKTDFLLLTRTDFYRKFGKPTLILCNPPFNGQKTPKIKRNYSKCFLCGSTNLWTKPKLPFCLECRNSADNCPTCLDCLKPVNNGVVVHHKFCSPPRCYHQGEKDYFSICNTCYGEVPLIKTSHGRFRDWNWIIEKQNQLESKTKSVSRLGSEIWLDKILELFGKEVPIVLFAPIGFRMNLTLKSKRHEKFDNGTYPPIVSCISLPKNIFEGVIFHSEILIFNIKGLKPHYFLKKHEKSGKCASF